MTRLSSAEREGEISPELEAAVDRVLATQYRTMPAWMRWLDARLRWWRNWRERPYVVVPRWLSKGNPE